MLSHLPEKPLTRADVEAAADTLGILGMASELTEPLVKSAYRSSLRESHPDTGGPVELASDRLARLQGARDTLLRWLAETPNNDCICGGTGFIPSGAFSSKPCPHCARGK